MNLAIKEPKLCSFSNHLSKHPPSLSQQCCDEREMGARQGESVEQSDRFRTGKMKKIGCQKKEKEAEK